MRVEYRVPDAASNPYALNERNSHGRCRWNQQETGSRELGFGPIDDDVFRDGFDASRLGKLPGSLEEALGELEQDREFLEREGVFPAELVDEYVKEREIECAAFKGNPHPLEHRLYFSL